MSHRERKAAAKLAGALAAAREVEAAAATRYEIAERVLHSATIRRIAAQGPAATGVSRTGQPVPPPGESREELNAARAAEAQAREWWQDAGYNLQRARVALGNVERRIEVAIRAARA